MCFDSLYVPTSENQGDLTAVEKEWYRSSSRSRSISWALYVSGKGFSHRQHRFTRSSYFPPSTVIKKSFEKAQKKSRDLDSEDVEELAKQTLLSTEDVEVIFQKRVRVFHRGFKHEKTDESTRPQAECFNCFRVFETPMKHEARVFELTSPTKEN